MPPAPKADLSSALQMAMARASPPTDATYPGLVSARTCLSSASSQFDYAQEEQKDPRDNGRDEQRAATAEPVGEEDEHDDRME